MVIRKSVGLIKLPADANQQGDSLLLIIEKIVIISA